MDKLNQHKCNNCGANLTYDRKHHRYVCQYCNSVFNENKKSDDTTRIELTPDDLKEVSSNIEMKSTMTVARVIFIIVIVLTVLTSIFPFIIVGSMFFGY